MGRASDGGEASGMSPDPSWAAELLEIVTADLALCPGSADLHVAFCQLLSPSEPLFSHL